MATGNDIRQMDAVTVASNIRARELSPLEVVQRE